VRLHLPTTKFGGMWKSPKTGKRPSLRTISQALTEQGFHSPSGRPYGAESVKRMLDANG
jgi:hypothetical protein